MKLIAALFSWQAKSGPPPHPVLCHLMDVGAVATELLNIVIMELNNKLRNEEILLASKSKQYLEEEVIKAQLSDVRVAISDLIQQQIGKIAMANSSPQYLFKVLANPYPPERKFKPKRSIIVILYSMFGIFVGCSIVLLRKFIYQSKRI